MNKWMLIVIVAVLVALFVTSGAGALEPRDAETILKEYQAVVMPSYDPSKREDVAYLQKLNADRMSAISRRHELARELFRTQPGHPRVASMMIEGWANMLGRPEGEKMIQEADELLKQNLDERERTEVLFSKAQGTVFYARGDVEKALAAAEGFVEAAPKDPRGPSLLLMAAQAVRDPQEQSKVYRRIAEQFPGTPAAQSAQGKIVQVEKVGKPFELSFTEAITGETVSMEKLKGKVVVIDFWATWCGPCIADMPKMKERYAAYKPKGVEFIGVSLDQPEAQGGLTKLKDYCRDNQIAWPQYYQGNGWDSEFSKSWRINSIPAVFIIDAEGNLHSTQARGRLEQMIPELLKKRDAKAKAG